MSKALDDVLGRVKLTIAKGESADRIRRAITDALEKVTTVDPDIYNIVSDIRAAIKPEGRSVQIGNAGRQLSEYILKHILPTPAKQSLFDRIENAIGVSARDQIDNIKYAPAATWMNGYFQLLRLLGNETSHHEDSIRVPQSIEDKDVILILLAIERVLAFFGLPGALTKLPRAAHGRSCLPDPTEPITNAQTWLIRDRRANGRENFGRDRRSCRGIGRSRQRRRSSRLYP
jgi:hypothetical protein